MAWRSAWWTRLSVSRLWKNSSPAGESRSKASMGTRAVPCIGARNKSNRGTGQNAVGLAAAVCTTWCK